jgi:hypothetical protein
VLVQLGSDHRAERSSEDHRLRATRACIGLLRGYMPFLLTRNRPFVTRGYEALSGLDREGSLPTFR